MVYQYVCSPKTWASKEYRVFLKWRHSSFYQSYLLSGEKARWLEAQDFFIRNSIPTFIWNFFSWDAYFRRRWVLNRIYSAFSVHYISTISIFRAPWLRLEGDRHMCSQIFYTKFNSQQLLSEVFFHGICIFGISVLCAYWHIYNTSYVDCNDVTIHCPLQIEPTCLSIYLGGKANSETRITRVLVHGQQF